MRREESVIRGKEKEVHFQGLFIYLGEDRRRDREGEGGSQAGSEAESDDLTNHKIMT